jgi:DNA-binding response OmpR family regulator
LQVIGTGIGLSLVRQIVLRHSGEIKVESHVGQGTQFTLLLPLGTGHLKTDEIQLPAPEAGMIYAPGPAYFAPNIEEPAFPVKGASLAVCKLLIVEDNEEVREYLRQLFAPVMAVEVAADGLEGWEKVLDTLPDLAISDIMMPHSEGLELCGKIKRHLKTMHIPVVLMTARVAPVHELEGLEMRADDYVMKPFHPRLLQAKVVSMLQNRQKLQEFYHRQILLQPTDLVIPDEDQAFLETAMKIVEANLENPDLGEQVLLKEMGTSQSVFYRRLKGITGQSALEFIQDIRLKRAAQLLLESSLRVTEIAFKVSIEDIKYFRKLFQKLYHVSPTEYAKQSQSSVLPD